MADKPLTELSEKELREALVAQMNRNVNFNYNDVAIELERRIQQRNANKIYLLSILSLIISVLSLVASVLVALFK